MSNYIHDYNLTFDTATADDIAICINKFGTQDHPYADERTLSSFAVDYVVDCITNGIVWLQGQPEDLGDGHYRQKILTRLCAALDVIKNAHVSKKENHHV